MADQTYFQIFGLNQHLRLDTAALEQQFYALSRRLHPDRFAREPPAEQHAALAAASELNDAYRTLRDPVARTGYLLHLHGVELEEQSKAATEAARGSGTEKKQAVPPELLEEVFELNMQLTELKAAKQMGEDEPGLRAELQTAKGEFDGKLAATQADLETLWATWDTALDRNDETSQRAARDGMVAVLNRRTYLRNLVRDVDAALES